MGIIGLGKIGANLALQCLEKGISVVGLDKEDKPELSEKGAKIAKTYDEFANLLSSPRITFLSLPAGESVDQVISKLIPCLDEGDVIIDGGNSYYKDSIRRESDLSKLGICFVDCGTSGGLAGARYGACLMVGGKPEAISKCENLLKTLCVEDGFLKVGGPGSGHFVKLVHNGIEFGMTQAIGEGFELLKNGDFPLDLQKVFQLWSHGSVIRGWLIELMAEGLKELPDLDEVPSYVEDTGEVNWLVKEAIEKEISAPVITQSVLELFRSRQIENDVTRAVAIMRHGFGGHPYGKDTSIAEERKHGRIR